MYTLSHNVILLPIPFFSPSVPCSSSFLLLFLSLSLRVLRWLCWSSSCSCCCSRYPFFFPCFFSSLPFLAFSSLAFPMDQSSKGATKETIPKPRTQRNTWWREVDENNENKSKSKGKLCLGMVHDAHTVR